MSTQGRAIYAATKGGPYAFAVSGRSITIGMVPVLFVRGPQDPDWRRIPVSWGDDAQSVYRDAQAVEDFPFAGRYRVQVGIADATGAFIDFTDPINLNVLPRPGDVL